MKQTRKRQSVAWTLLSIILSMLLFSSFHVHEECEGGKQECYQCASHQPHAGHFSLATHGVQDCLICQLVTVPFLIAALVTITMPLHQNGKAHSLRASFLPYSPVGFVKLRAPPFLS